MCGFQAIGTKAASQSCVTYSFGSNANVVFEKAVKKQHPSCDIITFDPTLNSEKTNIMRKHETSGLLKFVDQGLGFQDGTISFAERAINVSTLRTLVRAGLVSARYSRHPKLQLAKSMRSSEQQEGFCHPNTCLRLTHLPHSNHKNLPSRLLTSHLSIHSLCSSNHPQCIDEFVLSGTHRALPHPLAMNDRMLCNDPCALCPRATTVPISDQNAKIKQIVTPPPNVDCVLLRPVVDNAAPVPYVSVVPFT
eukprot:5356665-Pleurochrysis_carterae.AAC.1